MDEPNPPPPLSPEPAPEPLPPVRKSVDARTPERAGLVTMGLFLALVLLYVWQRWGPGEGVLRTLVVQNWYKVRLWFVVVGSGAGVFAIVQAARVLQDRDRPLAERLRAGYGFSYAAAALLIATMVFLVSQYKA